MVLRVDRGSGGCAVTAHMVSRGAGECTRHRLPWLPLLSPSTDSACVRAQVRACVRARARLPACVHSCAGGAAVHVCNSASVVGWAGGQMGGCHWVGRWMDGWVQLCGCLPTFVGQPRVAHYPTP